MNVSLVIEIVLNGTLLEVMLSSGAVMISVCFISKNEHNRYLRLLIDSIVR